MTPIPRAIALYVTARIVTATAVIPAKIASLSAVRVFSQMLLLLPQVDALLKKDAPQPVALRTRSRHQPHAAIAAMITVSAAMTALVTIAPAIFACPQNDATE